MKNPIRFSNKNKQKLFIYHYYDSKEQLLFDIIHSHLAQVHDAIATVSNHGEDPEVHLRHLVAELLMAYRGADAEHLARDGEDEGLPRQWSQSGGQSHRRAI